MKRAAVVVYIVSFAATFFAWAIGDPARTVTLFAAGFGSIAAATYLAISTRSVIWATWALYVVLAMTTGITSGIESPRWLFGVAVSLTIACAIVGMALIVRAVRRERELERVLSLEATSFAFFITMVAALGYALVDSVIGLPVLTMWPVFLFGMVTWGIGAVLFRRRYS